MLGGLFRPLVRGEGEELTWSCTLQGSSFALPQWCLSIISAAVLLKQPPIPSELLLNLNEALLRGVAL